MVQYCGSSFMPLLLTLHVNLCMLFTLSLYSTEGSQIVVLVVNIF